MKFTKTVLTSLLGVGLAASGLPLASASPEVSSDPADRSATDLYSVGKDDRFDADEFIKSVLK
ncbi:hypothetical protein ACFT4A_15170 [Streptomyces sp. NPDC057099]|uniref:hypothetical protein n=1 Tax=Streptomyces sp. NPDC057099 TaxID=3346019 RepID=UPI0036293739